MALDVHNPWQAVAYFALGFYCEDCEKCLVLETSLEPCSDEWCVEIAQSAFNQGWFVRHPQKDGSMDVVSAWCPQCGKKLGLTQPAYETFISNE